MSTVTNPCPQIFKLMHHPSFSPHFYPCCDFYHHHSHKHGSSYSRPFCFTFHLISSQYSPLFSTSSVAKLALSLIVTEDWIFVYTNCLNWPPWQLKLPCHCWWSTVPSCVQRHSKWTSVYSGGDIWMLLGFLRLNSPKLLWFLQNFSVDELGSKPFFSYSLSIISRK